AARGVAARAGAHRRGEGGAERQPGHPAGRGGGRERRAPARAHRRGPRGLPARSEEHTSELQSRENLVCRLLLEKKKIHTGSASAPLAIATHSRVTGNAPHDPPPGCARGWTADGSVGVSPGL